MKIRRPQTLGHISYSVLLPKKPATSEGAVNIAFFSAPQVLYWIRPFDWESELKNTELIMFMTAVEDDFCFKTCIVMLKVGI